MITDIYMLTGNPFKFEIARDFFGHAGVPLTQLDIDSPEIQSMDVEEVARVAAMAAAKEHNVPVFKTDVGLYIEALNGFPGPLLKFIHPTFSPQDWLNLMGTKKNRTASFREALVIAFPDGKSVTFVDDVAATFHDSINGKSDTPSIDQVLIIDGNDRTTACYAPNELLAQWKSNQTIYTRAAKYIKDMT